MSEMGKELRRLMKEEETVVLPGAYDALSGALIEQVGFDAIVHTGYGTAASLLAQPDWGLVSFAEMRDQVRSISRNVELPVLADADTGYGNPVNVRRTVKEYREAGSAGLWVEDQVWPKRCGHMEGKDTIDRERALSKISAALDARDDVDKDFVVGMRTDTIYTEGFNEAIERSKEAVELGVDFMFVEALETKEQMKIVNAEVDAPTMLNLIEGGKTPLTSVEEAKELGFDLVVFPLTNLYAATKARLDVLNTLKEEGTADEYMEKLVKFDKFKEVIDVPKLQEIERQYLPDEEVDEKYKN